MRINNNLSTLPFLKILKASGAIKDKDKITPVSIYQLDDNEDLIEIRNLKTKPNWQGNYYLDDVAIFGKNYLNRGFDIHTIENDTGDILCYSLIDETQNHVDVILLETAPKLSRYNSNRDVKYIGETMVAFLATFAKSKNKDLIVRGVADRRKTQDFYFSLCKFSRMGDENAVLKKRTVKKLVENNEKHTGKKVELIG